MIHIAQNSNMSTRHIKTLIKNRRMIKKKLTIIEKYIDSIEIGSLILELSI